MEIDTFYRDRTDRKLEFARLYLQLRLSSDNRGGVAERAHEESFLFHLVGTLDAFKREIKNTFERNQPAENPRSSEPWRVIKALKQDKGG